MGGRACAAHYTAGGLTCGFAPRPRSPVALRGSFVTSRSKQARAENAFALRRLVTSTVDSLSHRGDPPQTSTSTATTRGRVVSGTRERFVVFTRRKPQDGFTELTLQHFGRFQTKALSVSVRRQLRPGRLRRPHATFTNCGLLAVTDGLLCTQVPLISISRRSADASGQPPKAPKPVTHRPNSAGP